MHYFLITLAEKELQEILTERSKLQTAVSQEENEKSQLQFRLIDLDKILKELLISITQKKYILKTPQNGKLFEKHSCRTRNFFPKFLHGWKVS